MFRGGEGATIGWSKSYWWNIRFDGAGVAMLIEVCGGK